MRKFHRPLGNRTYKKLFIISVEGSKTEPQYFSIINQLQAVVLIKCLKRPFTQSSLTHVLKKMEFYLHKESLRKGDEAWIVVDKDDWTESQLKELFLWSKKRQNYGLALSNPSFEYWLLLHFEDGKDLANIQECLARLKRYLPNYKKELDSRKITLDHIAKAISRAKKRNTTREKGLPVPWSTDVHILVERILSHK